MENTEALSDRLTSDAQQHRACTPDEFYFEGRLLTFVMHLAVLKVRIHLESAPSLSLAHSGSDEKLQCESSLQPEDRFTMLFDELRIPLLRYLMRAGMSREDAEEIAQETFLRLFKHLLEKGREDNLRGWVFRVSHNLAVDRHKDRRRFTTKSQEEWGKLSEMLNDCSPNPEEFLMSREKIAGINRAITSLSIRQSQCVYLRTEGLRYREIAEALGITMATVAESLRRAGKKLQEHLSREWS